MPDQLTIAGPDEGERTIRTVVADPPWSCESGGGESKRGADRHYPLLDRDEIVGVIQHDCPPWRRLAESAHLYLWTTNNALARGDAHYVARNLGFRPVTLITWVKGKPGQSFLKSLELGLGYYFRHCTEQVLFCVRGETIEPDDKPPTVMKQPTGAHSEKPSTLYNFAQRASPPRYLELFAREERDGWICWGDEL